MILTCPACATRYSTSAEAIGPNGRNVKCSNCDENWFVAADPDILTLRDEERAQTIIQETPPEERFEEQFENDDRFDTGDNVGFGVTPVKGAHVHIRDLADQRRRNRRLMGISLVWVLLLAALFIAALCAYMFRQAIVERQPAAASVYKAFNIDVKVNGLNFEDPKTRNVVLDGTPTLVVNGYIQNVSDESRDIPLIELSLVSASNDILSSWIVQPSQPKLDAGERLEYISEFPNPPIEMETLKYKFLDEGEIVPPAIPEAVDQE